MASVSAKVKIPAPVIDCRRQRGTVLFWRGIEWATLLQNDILNPRGDQKLKTGDDGYVAISTAIESDFIMFPKTEVIVSPTTIDPESPQRMIVVGTLANGEVNVSSNFGGMPWNVDNFRIRGHGLIKITYDSAAKKGEIAVKSGTFEVHILDQARNGATLIGGQKVTFERQQLVAPCSISNELYDWNVDILFK
ncbi:MAG: hypothetical protein HQM09_08805 [Candidatus Riflebacteria bacterium]|nr:hypothetical protein [Candidatus Riflebacteria bacterium]